MTEMNSYYPAGGEGNERRERSEQGPWIVARERNATWILKEKTWTWKASLFWGCL